MYISRSLASKLCVCLCNITCIYTWYLNAVLFGSHSCLVLKLYSNCLKCTCCMFLARLLAWCLALQAEIYLYCAFSPSLPNPSPLLSATPSSPASSSSLSRLALSLSRWFLPPWRPSLSQQDKMSRTEVKRRSDGIIKSKQTHYRRGEIGAFASTSHPFHSECNVSRSITTNQRCLLMSHFARQVDLICCRAWIKRYFLLCDT